MNLADTLPLSMASRIASSKKDTGALNFIRQSIIETEKPDVYIVVAVDRHLADPPQVTSPAAKVSKR